LNRRCVSADDENFAALKNHFRNHQGHRPRKPACRVHSFDKRAGPYHFEKHDEHPECDESERDDVAPDHPFAMLFHHAAAYRNHSKPCSHDPGAAHSDHSHSEDPPEIGVKSQVKGGRSADAHRRGVACAEYTMQRRCAAIERKPELQRTEQDGDTSRQDVHCQPLPAWRKDTEPARFSADIGENETVDKPQRNSRR